MTNLDRISESARRNPEGLLLLAAGVALLLRHSSSSPSRSSMRSRRDRSPSYGEDEHDSEGMATQATRSVGRYATQFRDSVSETASGVAETASEYASSAQDYVEGASRRIADRSTDYARRAQSTVQENIDRVVQEQPLAIALAGLAAGAAVAAAFPATQIERDTLGQAGEQLTEAAATAKRKAGEAASVAGSELKRVADEKGLNADGLQETAKEIGEAIGDALEDSGSGSTSSLGSGSTSGSASRGTSGQAGSAGRGRSGKSMS
jgi:hypothetical protein